MSDIIERAARVAVESLEAHHEKCRIAVREACGFDLGPAPNRDVEAWIIAGALADAGVLRPTITEEMVERAEAAIIESVFGKEQAYIDYIDIAREALEAALEETS